MIRKASLPAILLLTVLLCSSWGFFSHQRINRLAVFTLPGELIRFYKDNINYVTEHAVDPDKRRYSDSLEAPRHFLDADHYGSAPFENLPQQYEAAVTKYSKDTIQLYGIVPWQIQRVYYGLVKAFQERDSSLILRLSADLGHYIADAHVPLHTTENYNGQFTNQVGIHGFWESRLPELFSGSYDFFVGKAQYVEDPLGEAWKIVRHSYQYKDSVLLIEARLSASFPSDRKYTFSQRNGRVEKQYSEEYSRAYHNALKGMVERQMRASILAVGSFWYSAWIDAGQPKLRNLTRRSPSDLEKKQVEQEERLYQKGKILGRQEAHY